MASVWQDNKPVTMLSTLAQADVTHIAQRKMSRASVQCTDTVVLYNQYISGVDKGDQLRQYYRVRMRCYKNYKYMFLFLFDVSITNRILSLYAPTSMALSHQCLKQFRLKLAKQLVGDYNSQKRLGCPSFVPVHPPSSRLCFAVFTCLSMCWLCRVYVYMFARFVCFGGECHVRLCIHVCVLVCVFV